MKIASRLTHLRTYRCRRGAYIEHVTIVDSQKRATGYAYLALTVDGQLIVVWVDMPKYNRGIVELVQHSFACLEMDENVDPFLQRFRQRGYIVQ